MLRDGRSIESGTRFAHDVCIVGAGPAGIAMAERLAASGVTVALVESGGFEQTVPGQRLNRGEVIGHPYWPLQSSRFRVFGGSANRWGGMSRPLDDIDFEHRDWIEHSGWPIPPSSLSKYDEAVADVLGLPSNKFDAASWADQMPEPIRMDGSDFDNVVFQFSPTKMSFGDRYRERITAAPAISTYLNSTVTDLRLDDSSNRIGSVEVLTLTGRRFTIAATVIVLAAGAIENARLLLSCTTDRPAGLGNGHDLVGRYFMEHLHVDGGLWLAADAAASRAFYGYQRQGEARLQGLLAASATAQRTHRLPAASIAIDAPVHPVGQPFLTWPPELTVVPERLFRQGARRLEALRARPDRESEVTHRRSGPTGEAIRALGGRLWYTATSVSARRAVRSAVAQAGEHPTAARHSLYLRTEQVPNPDSRIRLGEQRDALGLYRAQLDWQLTDQDRDGARAWIRRLGDYIDRAGLGQVLPAEDDGWNDRIIGGPHHMGTTRMADDPRQGVVDANGRVHETSNLYVAGSSVFPTGGYVNPTFSLLALSLRLADHLSDELGARRPATA